MSMTEIIIILAVFLLVIWAIKDDGGNENG